VLRLLPDRLVIGLFPGHCWLQAGRRIEAVDAGADAPTVAQQFDAAARRGRALAGRRARVEVLLSDAHARVALLPWQPQLLAGPQLQAYAQACLERAGARLDGQWAVHGGYRGFARTGMVAAVPEQLLSALTGTATAHGLRLAGVQPVTGAAYWRRARTLRRRAALFLCEPERLTLLRCGPGGVASIDVQPVGTDVALALRRLVRRDAGERPHRVELWAPHGHTIAPDAFVREYGDVPLRRWAPAAWSRA
jgi:hypothetical protein